MRLPAPWLTSFPIAEQAETVRRVPVVRHPVQVAVPASVVVVPRVREVDVAVVDVPPAIIVRETILSTVL